MNINNNITKTSSVQESPVAVGQSNTASNRAESPIPTSVEALAGVASSLPVANSVSGDIQAPKHPFFASDSSLSKGYEGKFDLDAILLDLGTRIKQGENFSFVIGRGNKEKACEPNGTTWVYCNIDGSSMIPGLEERPHLWLDFDSKEHLSPVVNALRGKIAHIFFDYSVLKFFDNFTTEILPMLRDLLKTGGKLYIPDLQQMFGIEENPLPIEQQQVFGNLNITVSESNSMAQPFFDDMLEKVGIELDNSLASFYRQAKRKNETDQSYLEWVIEYLRNTGKFEEAILDNAREQSVRADRCSAEIYGRWMQAKTACLQKYFGKESVEVRKDDQFPISATCEKNVSVCTYFVATKALE